MPYIMAKVQMKYGTPHLDNFLAALSHIREMLEQQGPKLSKVLSTQIGTLYEVWDLWEVDGPDQLPAARRAMRAEPKNAERLAKWMPVLIAAVASEHLIYLDEIPVSSPADEIPHAL